MYDSDVSTYDSTGKVYQVLYAEEAPKQGAPLCAICTANGVVLIASIGQNSKLSVPQPKIFEVQDNILMGISGIYADAKKDVATARVLANEHQLKFGEMMPALNLLQELASQAQQRTYISSSRPHGVGIVLATIEHGQPAVYYTSPSADYKQFKALAIGRNAQAANAFLCKNYKDTLSESDAIEFGVRALQKAVGEELKAIEVWTMDLQGYRKAPGEHILMYVYEKFKQVQDEDSD